jgi:hypothetical protein
MMVVVMLLAKPANLERLGVVVMMSLDITGATALASEANEFTRQLIEFSITDKVVDYGVSGVFESVALNPCCFRASGRLPAFGCLEVFFSRSNSVRQGCTSTLIFSVMQNILQPVLTNASGDMYFATTFIDWIEFDRIGYSAIDTQKFLHVMKCNAQERNIKIFP